MSENAISIGSNPVGLIPFTPSDTGNDSCTANECDDRRRHRERKKTSPWLVIGAYGRSGLCAPIGSNPSSDLAYGLIWSLEQEPGHDTTVWIQRLPRVRGQAQGSDVAAGNLAKFIHIYLHLLCPQNQICPEQKWRNVRSAASKRPCAVMN